MCTSSCQSSYGSDFKYLMEQSSISSSNSIYKKLKTKTNLSCVRNFLADIAHKVS